MHRLRTCVGKLIKSSNYNELSIDRSIKSSCYVPIQPSSLVSNNYYGRSFSSRATDSKQETDVFKKQLFAFPSFKPRPIYYYLGAFATMFAIDCPPSNFVECVILLGGTGAFTIAAVEVLVDVLKEQKVRFLRPFSVGDTIKIGQPAGYMEGKVLKIGLFATTLVLANNDQLIVPHSNISRKVVVRSIVKRIPLRIDDVYKVSRISENIESMLRLNPNVYLDMEVPYCSCSLERSWFELTLKFDVKNKKSEKDILTNVVRIIKENGGELISDARQNGESSWGHRSVLD